MHKNLFARLIADIATLVIIGIIGMFSVRLFGGMAIMSGSSMAPNVKDGDTVLVAKGAYLLKAPERMDVVMIDRNGGTVKRVVGVPGDVVEIKEGKLFINGKAKNDARLSGDYQTNGVAELAVTLKENEYFVLGDNPAYSQDSRFSSFGLVKRQEMTGRVWMVIAPFSHLGAVR